jgi:hypothetical protein
MTPLAPVGVPITSSKVHRGVTSVWAASSPRTIAVLEGSTAEHRMNVLRTLQQVAGGPPPPVEGGLDIGKRRTDLGTIGHPKPENAGR